jgi:hypothetical protein
MSNSLTIQELQSLLDSIAHVKESKELATLGNATSCHSVTLRSLCQQLLATMQRLTELEAAYTLCFNERVLLLQRAAEREAKLKNAIQMWCDADSHEADELAATALIIALNSCEYIGDVK